MSDEWLKTYLDERFHALEAALQRHADDDSRSFRDHSKQIASLRDTATQANLLAKLASGIAGFLGAIGLVALAQLFKRGGQ